MYQDDVTKPMDADAVHNIIKQILFPIYTPLVAGAPVSITDDNGNPITEDDIVNNFMQCCQAFIDTDAEAFMHTLFKNTLAAYDPALRADSIFIAQDNVIAKCPTPSSNVIYIPDDLKNACMQYIQDPDKYREFLHCTEAFVMNEKHMGAHFMAKPIFDDFKNYVASMTSPLSPKLKPETIQKFTDFGKMQLNTIEGLILRKQDGEDDEEYSFSRLLIKFLLDFSKTTPNVGIFTPYVSEFIIPKNLIFYDIDQVCRCPKAKLSNLIDMCKQSMTTKYVQTSFNKINKMSQIAANMSTVQAKIKNAMQIAARQGKRKIFRFSNKTIGQKELANRIRKLISREFNVSMSENYQKNITQSYLKPNRHDPEDFNKKGAMTRTIYKPDLHIYLDTSSSISEINYRNAIKTCIYMAKKLGINIYFNSFSDSVSQETKLHIKGKTTKEIYNEFQRVPKTIGGTDFENVWKYIMASKKRRKQISLMITDFGDSPRSDVIAHPPKLWYIPIDVSPRSWDSIKELAEDFCKAMFYIDKNIRKKLLM